MKKITLQSIKDFFADKDMSEKIREKTMSDEDWKDLNQAFSEKFGVNLTEAVNAAKENADTEEKLEELTTEKKEALAAIYADTEEKEANADTSLVDAINDLKEKITKMEETPESKDADMKKPAKAVFIGMGPAKLSEYAFGIPDPYFAMSKPWNQRTMNGKYVENAYDDDEAKALSTELKEYTKAFAERVDLVKRTGMINAIMAGSVDYTDLESELGAYYRVRRMDQIIIDIMKLPSITNLFPLHSNVQDEETITNSFEGKSFSQPYQKGKVVSGSFTFQPDKAKMSDVMFKHEFSDLKELEKEYIGYLNKEGSSPFKWSFVEWLMMQCAIIQHNERQERWLKGIRVEPTSDKTSFYMYGSTGILNDLDHRKEVKNQIYVVEESKVYNDSTIVGVAESFVGNIFTLLGQRMKSGLLIMNLRHMNWFLTDFRTTYGRDLDYDGDKFEIKNFNNVTIRFVDMGAERYDMWFQPVGAYEVLENKPGEFYQYKTQLDWESIYMMSYAKEGVFAFAGRQFDTKAKLIASKGRYTHIFANNPVTVLAADATTADATVNELFETQANTAATALTDITSAVEGVLYKIKCGDLTNKTTIAKANKFANITAAWTPTAVGDYIKVIYDPTADEFLEYERVVGGTRTVNANLKAPEFVG